MECILKYFHFQPGHHCFYSSLFNIFQYMGLPLKEYELFILSAGLSFQMAMEWNSAFFDHILEAIKIDYQNQLNILCHRIHIKKQEFYDFNGVYDSLCRNRPVLAFLKTAALKHNMVQNPRDNLGAHGLTIYGVNLEEDRVYVADTYVLDYENHVHTYNLQLKMSELTDHIIGFCSFDVSDYSMMADTVNQAYCESVKKYFDTQSNNGEDAILYIIRNLNILNEGKRLTDSSQNNYITLIFLLKAYFLNILNYIEELIYNVRASASDTIHELIMKIRINLNAFFLRCLSNVGRIIEKDERTANSGEIAIKLYSDLLRRVEEVLNYC